MLVRIKAAGLCHSDLSVINGNRPRPLPMALGHEAAGIVEELGPGTWTDLEGRRSRVFVFVPSCGHCAPCTEGRPALCEPGAASNTAGTLLSGSRGSAARAEPLNHHLGVSGFAEYATVSRHSLVKIDPEVPLDEAALFGCAVLTGVGAVVNTARMQRRRLASRSSGSAGSGWRHCSGPSRRRSAADHRRGPGRARLRIRAELGATHVVNSTEPERASRSGRYRRRCRIRLRPRRSVPPRSTWPTGSRAAAASTVTAGLPPSTAMLPLSP